MSSSGSNPEVVLTPYEAMLAISEPAKETIQEIIPELNAASRLKSAHYDAIAEKRKEQEDALATFYDDLGDADPIYRAVYEVSMAHSPFGTSEQDWKDIDTKWLPEKLAEIEQNARELLALNDFLGTISTPQVVMLLNRDQVDKHAHKIHTFDATLMLTDLPESAGLIVENEMSYHPLDGRNIKAKQLVLPVKQVTEIKNQATNINERQFVLTRDPDPVDPQVESVPDCNMPLHHRYSLSDGNDVRLYFGEAEPALENTRILCVGGAAVDSMIKVLTKDANRDKSDGYHKYYDKGTLEALTVAFYDDYDEAWK